MGERYTRLFLQTDMLYTEGAPVILVAGALLKDNLNGRVVVQLKFRNISNSKICALKVKVFALDSAERRIGEEQVYEFLDLSVERNQEFGQNQAITLVENTARSFFVEIMEVVFEDKTIWNGEDGTWSPLPKLDKLQTQIKDLELLRQYRMEICEKAQCVYEEYADIWRCTCGTINHLDEEKCFSCGTSRDLQKTCSLEDLEKHKEKRLQEQAAKEAERVKQDRIEWERRMEESSQKKKRNQRIALLCTIAVAIILIVLFVKIYAIPELKYQNAIDLMNSRRYTEAIQAFEEMNGYKNSAQMIIDCNNGVQYVEAERLIKQEDYMGAADIFKALGDYADSSSRYEECIRLEYDDDYQTALRLMENKKYKEAEAIFRKLEGYSDSKELAISCANLYKEYQYSVALNKMEEGEYAEAITTFEELGNYENSGAYLLQCETDLINSCKKDDIVYFGTYDDGRRIKWRVLEKQPGKILVLSENIISDAPFLDTYTTSQKDWSDSSLRNWLNDTVLSVAFSSYEQDRIELESHSFSGIDGEKECEDKMFLLSVTEVNKYFLDDGERVAYYPETQTPKMWLLSDSFKNNKTGVFSVYSVTSSGTIDSVEGTTYSGVRPAMWIKTTG